ncbi:hypothetical protein SELMODRAFT_26993, partial [Selaginella moellendorffii]
LISALVREGRFHDAVGWFQRMLLEGRKPDRVCFVAVVGAYGGIGDLDKAKFIHGYLYRSGYEADIIVGTALVNLYAKCGSFRNARLMIFEGIVERDIVAWNTMVAAYEAAGHFREAVHTFWQMRAESRVTPNRISFAAVLRACAGLQDLRQTERVHGLTMELGMAGDEEVQASLVDAYLACGSPSGALGIFGSMVSRPPRSW